MDWQEWHRNYDRPGSMLAQRLAAVQAQITDVLDGARPGPIRVISVCAGEGRDLLGVLDSHPRRADVRARLVEADPPIAAVARDRAAAAGLDGVEVVTGDAARTGQYRDIAPAELVLVCGIFGNITDQDIERTVETCRQLCQTGGTVIWTRGRTSPDLVPLICQWFEERGFDRQWLSGPEVIFGVGAHRFRDDPQPLAAGQHMFTFTR